MNTDNRDPCWKGYEMIGMKTKGGKEVPNCVPKSKPKKKKVPPMIEKIKAKHKQ
jgi:hypothetical protein